MSHRIRIASILAAAAFASNATSLKAAISQGLGQATGYNVFVLGNSTRTNSDTEGRIAVGGNASFSSFSVASTLQNTNTNNLVVGGSLSVSGGTVYGKAIVGAGATLSNPTFNNTLDVTGSVLHTNYGSFTGNVTVSGNWNSQTGYSTNGSLQAGGTVDITGSATIPGGLKSIGDITIQTPTISNGVKTDGKVAFTGGGGSVNGGVVYGKNYTGPSYISNTKGAKDTVVSSPTAVSTAVDFSAAQTYLQGAAASWGALSANGTNQLQYSTRTLSGTSSSLNVFSLTAADFNNVSTFNINVPSGSTVLINIAGTTVNLPNIGYALNGAALGSSGSGAAFGNLLWNAFEASTIQHYSLGGSLLAPNAAVTFSSGQHNGMAIVGSYTGSGENHNYAFTGTLPSTGGGSSIPEPAALSLLSAPIALLARRRRS